MASSSSSSIHKSFKHEAKFIQKIVEELSLELRSISFNIDEKLVGMKSRVKEVVSSLGTGFDVLMIGIKGMGGGGKTTLARAVFDQISSQFEEMGRNIVRRSHPDKPQKHSRLWVGDEIEEILANDLGTKATRCIHTNYALKLHNVTKGLRKMKGLRFLSVLIEGRFHNLKSEKVSLDFPDALRYLSMKCYPFRSLPKTFQANNLVALVMAYSSIKQLWEGGGRKVFNKMRFLDLSHSRLRTLDLGLAPNLETLNLEGCNNLVELHMPIRCLKLISVDISHSRLRTLDLRLAPNLKTLILYACRYLVEFQMASICLNLKSL
ncbi:unnamed protein product [Lactuca saligna]|uniref:NB-ARC domain-containing protein n=1 Tax=Lactuca saligna TaxID=75948 RepID=A0AA35YYK7_LACSI|nr:unnamed protein product [Lactuca saligna]